METTFESTLKTYQRAVETYLNGCFTDKTQPQQTLFDAMRYSLLAGGKRIRPVLVLEFCRLCGGNWEKAMDFAAALEMIHTYSLIHDDLPCMDNDDYRRGRLTNHKVYGEAQAVLAGDGLLTAAFSTAAGADAPAETVVEIVRTLSRCAGELGMVGGQVLDMEGGGQDPHAPGAAGNPQPQDRRADRGRLHHGRHRRRRLRRPAGGSHPLRRRLGPGLPNSRRYARRRGRREKLGKPSMWMGTRVPSSPSTAWSGARPSSKKKRRRPFRPSPPLKIRLS